MSGPLDETLLDSAERLADGDREDLLRGLATAGAQVRESLALAGEADVAGRLGGLRPRALLLSADPAADDVVFALAAFADRPDATAPVTRLHGPVLPVWAGAIDVLLAAGHAPTATAAPAVVEAASRRGLTVLGTGPADSLLHEACGRNRAPFVALPGGRHPYAAFWGLLTPLLVAAGELGVLPRTGEDLVRAADLLDALAERCAPARETYGNPAKSLALDLAESLPVLIGTTPTGGAAARRLAGQLAAAGRPAPWGSLPVALHRLGGLLAGAGEGPDDLFRDRVEDSGPARTRLVLVRDGEEPDFVRAEVDELVADCGRRGVAVTEVMAEQGAGPVSRLASVVGLVDFTAAYVALAAGGSGLGEDEA